MLAAEDVRRLIEARHDLDVDVALINPDPAMQGALLHMRGRMAVSADTVRTCARAVLKEDGEGRGAREKQLAASKAAEDEWRYYRGKVADHLLNPPRAVRATLTPTQLEARHAALLRTFPHNTTDFSRLTPAAKLEALRATIEAVGDEPLVRDAWAAEVRAQLTPVAEALDLANKAVTKENRDGQAAFEDLDLARADFDRRQSAYVTQVEAALKDTDHLDNIGRYILARDPAYRARRAAGQPIREEKGVEAITTDLGTTPDTIEATP